MNHQRISSSLAHSHADDEKKGQNSSFNSLPPGKFCMLFCRLLIFFKSTFLKNSFRNTIRVSNGLDPDQVRHFVGPNLGPNCLQQLSADGNSG